MTEPTRSNWMLYGAYGTTERLILDEAIRRGHRPVLAGRDRTQLEALGLVTGLQTIFLPVDERVALRAALSGVQCVLLAAGPYDVTGPPMRAGCLDAGCSYLDVNGELEDFSTALACDEAARKAGIAIIPGAGYGVAFGECVAAHVARRIPNPTWLRLSIARQTAGRSRGATLSTAAGVTAGGWEIAQGALCRRAIAFSTWQAPDGDGNRMRFAAAPVAELVAVHRSGGVPNVVAGIPLTRVAAGVLRVAGPWLGSLLTWQATHASRTPAGGATDLELSVLRSRVWAEAGDDTGARVVAVLESGEGYRAAAAAAVRAVELQLHDPRAGALTPVQAFGADFALRVPGTRLQDLDQS
jgi:short subunit dehydrogenase-like uncharacterized protein